MDLSIISIPILLIVNIYTFLWEFLTIVYIMPHNKSEKSTKKEPLVTAIVPACNEEKVVERIISDLDHMNYKKLEIIVVAHNSTDKTYALACGVKTRHCCRVLDLHTEESGKALALRHAMKHAQGELIAFFDTDNRIPKDFVSKCIPYFDSGYDGVQAKIMSKNPDKSLLTYLQTAEFLIYPKAYCGGKSRLGFNSGVGGTGIMFKKTVLDSIDGFKNMLIEDFDIIIRLTMRGYKIAYAEDAITYDEKVNSWKGLIRQRSRWLAGYFQLWKVYSWKDKLQLLRHPIDFIYFVNPLCLIALLTNYLLSIASFVGAEFVSAPFWWWVAHILILNTLFTLALRKESDLSWRKRLFMPWQVTVFGLHWFVVFFYSLRVRGWAKTDHGDA
jgi:cellulose synthase/poly-beta-1,6-N-acetylglucosamine synthase-like glycosyltransferase